MTTRAKTVILAFSMISLLAAPLAEAARVGSGKSSGMRRSAPTQSYQRQQVPPQQPVAPAPAAPQKKGPGVGTAIAAGAAGAAAGYMLGSAMSDKAGASAGAAAPASEGAGFPWGTLALVGLAVMAGMMFLRRRSAMAQQPQPAGMPMSAPQASHFEPIPKIGSGLGGGAAPAAPASLQRLSDGTEIPAFLRQAKATFMHLQSLNSADNVDEIRKYMTPELFAELRDDIASNRELADFPQLDCEVIDAADEGGRHIASVRFSGTVSEAIGAPAQPFAETWHYVKDASSGSRWLVAGIQQD